MARYIRIFGLLGALLAVWAYLLLQKGSQNIMIRWAPAIAILLYGIYAAYTIIHGVLTFNNCEKAYDDLKKEIAEAETFLISKGITFSDKYVPMSK
jgi:putative flippase GtrA